MKIRTEEWRDIWKWAKSVHNTEPKECLGGITYRRTDDGVLFTVPVSVAKANTTVQVLMTNDKKLVFSKTQFKEIYENPELLKWFDHDEYVDVVVDGDDVFFRFVVETYLSDFDVFLYIEVVFRWNLNQPTNEVLIGLEPDKWSEEKAGKVIWWSVRETDE